MSATKNNKVLIKCIVITIALFIFLNHTSVYVNAETKECRVNACHNTRQSGSQFCNGHTCDCSGCNRQVKSNGEKYCSYHANNSKKGSSKTTNAITKKCNKPGCRSNAKPDGMYCYTHSCCITDCSNYKDNFAHCCEKHNCKIDGCGNHKYTAKKSEYCQTHFVKK